jgi:hypothetical protein
MILNVGKIREKVHDPGRVGIKGKYIVPQEYEYWDPNKQPEVKPVVKDFNGLLDSMIQPAAPNKYKAPNAKQVGKLYQPLPAIKGKK